jgi:copper chaperone
MSILRLDGMKCQHCAQTAKKALEDLGATGVSIDLTKGEASYEGTLERDAVRQVMAEKGFSLVD